MKIIYMVGYEYDDFSEGGFDILFATGNEEKAIEVLEEKRKDIKDKTPFYGYSPKYAIRVLKLNEKNEEKVIKRLDI